MKTFAWYSMDPNHMVDAMLKPIEVKLGVTHIKLPFGCTVADDQIDYVLGSAFRRYNWIDFPDMAAPHAVRDFVRASGLAHTSMSTGDIIEVIDDEGQSTFHLVKGFGWQQLDPKEIGYDA